MPHCSADACLHRAAGRHYPIDDEKRWRNATLTNIAIISVWLVFGTTHWTSRGENN
jgi:hypothetical protein